MAKNPELRKYLKIDEKALNRENVDEAIKTPGFTEEDILTVRITGGR